MSRTPDPDPGYDPRLTEWLGDDPGRAPASVLKAVLATFPSTPQRRRSRWPWRYFPMQRALIAAGGVTAVLAVVVAGAVFWQPGRDVGPGVPGISPTPTGLQTPAPTATPTPTPTATPTPSPSASVTRTVQVGYPDLPGWIVFEHFGQAPDGSTTDLDLDRRMIWLVRADGTGLHELAPGKPADGKVSPDVSPDGRSVVFSSWTPRELVWEAGIDGGEPRLVSSGCDGRDACAEVDPAYSQDGTRIAFVRRETVAGTERFVIGIRARDGGELTLLEETRVDADEGYLSQPSWSPDGTGIVYTRNAQTPRDERITDARLLVAGVDGTGVRELPRPAGRWAADADWSPDGSRIVFSTAPERETQGWADGAPATGIHTIRPDGTDLQQACAACLGGGWAPSWTPDGRHILFWGYRTWALMDPDGGNEAHINQPELTWFGDRLGYGYAAVLQPSP